MGKFRQEFKHSTPSINFIGNADISKRIHSVENILSVIMIFLVVYAEQILQRDTLLHCAFVFFEKIHHHMKTLAGLFLLRDSINSSKAINFPLFIFLDNLSKTHSPSTLHFFNTHEYLSHHHEFLFFIFHFPLPINESSHLSRRF